MPNARAWFYGTSFHGGHQFLDGTPKPQRKTLTVTTLTYCDHCEQPCLEPVGDPDRAQFCCLCAQHADVCETCQTRKEKR